MQYTNHPRECDELLESICNDYEFVSSDYPTAWTFREFLKKLLPCDFSEIEEEVRLDNPTKLVMSVRIIFFTCRPKDAERLAFIARHFHWLHDWDWQILNDKGEVLYGKNF